MLNFFTLQSPQRQFDATQTPKKQTNEKKKQINVNYGCTGAIIPYTNTN